MKVDFCEAFDNINAQRCIDPTNVQARALRRFVWIAEWHTPGSLSESFSVFVSKEEAIECALMYADGENGAPRGMKTALRKTGRFDSKSPLYGSVITTIYRQRLADCF